MLNVASVSRGVKGQTVGEQMQIPAAVSRVLRMAREKKAGLRPPMYDERVASRSSKRSVDGV